ncbi:MAG: phosphoenolpyruvate--protein phosphotransferase [Elusimicrobia bacterium]|nr:phosphoenolpyruvate--protein phosphotransferase [Elusimicrobiota bacterium]
MLFKGISASSGIAIGSAFVIEDEEFCAVKRNIVKDDAKREVEKFRRAVSDTKADLEKIKTAAAKHLGKKHIKLFDAYLFISDDPVLKSEVTSKITKELINAEYALYEVIEENAKVFEKIKDEYFRERGKDIYDVGRKIMKHLNGIHKKTLADVEENSIVFADNLTPTDTIAMKNENVIGFATNQGGKTSHTAIMAQAMEIPAVVGMKDITANVVHGDIVIVDGNEGVVIVKPDPETLENYRHRLKSYEAGVKELSQFVNVPAVTSDGKKIIVAANIEIPEEVRSVISHGAEGIGLFRTEYLFINRPEFPSEQEQFESYSQVLEKVFPNPVIIRTIDLGGDKLLPYFNITTERNPFMGLRAIRFCLKYPEIFKIQLRAILRASVFGNVKMMYPMISGVDELRAANVILNEVKRELKSKSVQFDENIEVGVMIEIPSAALTVDLIAKEADFLSIGTNDLIQYTLAVDRVNEYVTHLYEPLHLSVIRLLKNIVDAGRKEGKWVSMCGEMAGDPSYTEILLGLGLEHLSMGAASVLRVKKNITKTNLSEAKKITEEILHEANRALLIQRVNQRKGR